MLYTLVTPAITISLDCTLKFEEGYTATVSAHQVETGSAITDHVYINNPKFTISGVVSDYNLYNPAKAGINQLSGVEGSLTINQPLTANVSFDSDGTLITDATLSQDESSVNGGDLSNYISAKVRSALISAWGSRTLFTILAGSEKDPTLMSAKNCAITNLTFADSPENGDGAVYPNITFEQLRFTSSQVVQKAPSAVPDALTSTKDSEDLGSIEGVNGETPTTNADGTPLTPAQKANMDEISANEKQAAHFREDTAANDKKIDAVQRYADVNKGKAPTLDTPYGSRLNYSRIHGLN